MIGAIHRARKAIHQDACIYGIATDGKHWIFMRIDNKSKVNLFNRLSSSQLTTQQQVSFGYSGYLDQAYTNLRTMVCHATHLALKRVAASTTENLPSSIQFYGPYSKLPPDMNIGTDAEFE